jgi:hypothetical protein
MAGVFCDTQGHRENAVPMPSSTRMTADSCDTACRTDAVGRGRTSSLWCHSTLRSRHTGIQTDPSQDKNALSRPCQSGHHGCLGNTQHSTETTLTKKSKKKKTKSIKTEKSPSASWKNVG